MDLRVDALRHVGPPQPVEPVTKPMPVEQRVQSDAASLAHAGSENESDAERREPIFNDTYAQFRIDSDSGRIQIKLIEQHSGKVLLEIPPDTILRLAAQLKKMSGLLLETER